jgi:hypothetical protein
MRNQRGAALNAVVWTLAGILVIVAAGFHIAHSKHESSVKFETPYQAVLLSNGSVYFGHLQEYGGRHPVLTDVFYIVSQTDPTTKQVSNVLVKTRQGIARAGPHVPCSKPYYIRRASG